MGNVDAFGPPLAQSSHRYDDQINKVPSHTSAVVPPPPFRVLSIASKIKQIHKPGSSVRPVTTSRNSSSSNNSNGIGNRHPGAKPGFARGGTSPGTTRRRYAKARTRTAVQLCHRNSHPRPSRNLDPDRARLGRHFRARLHLLLLPPFAQFRRDPAPRAGRARPATHRCPERQSQRRICAFYTQHVGRGRYVAFRFPQPPTTRWRRETPGPCYNIPRYCFPDEDKSI